ncbi:Fe-S-cluster-containing hydrogenase components 1 (plasmid) [Enterococcus mundtii]|uniref:Fe-S-cluster-containing hydrogenase components 1 n=2 Tax=Enterococcus mundtii TaxID=53346 RepID=A0AAI8RB53_ENTMU|nr:Fe-S-cluster-containing hydrogenase components 1 [Enterococcus mundtii]
MILSFFIGLKRLQAILCIRYVSSGKEKKMEGFILLGTFFLGIASGYALQTVILPVFMFEEWLKDRAIQQYFQCKKNEYTYFEEGKDDFYILTLNNQERRIKFSTKRPYTIVYDREVYVD